MLYIVCHPHFQTWISQRPVGHSWSNSMCSMDGLGDWHNVLGRLDQNCGFLSNKKLPKTYNGVNVVHTITFLFFVYSSCKNISNWNLSEKSVPVLLYNLYPRKFLQKCIFQKILQSNLDSSNTKCSFTMANSNSFLNPYEILPIAEENKYLGKFSHFITIHSTIIV